MLVVSWYVEYRGHLSSNTMCTTYVVNKNTFLVNIWPSVTGNVILCFTRPVNQEKTISELKYNIFISWVGCVWGQDRHLRALCVCVPSVEERAGLWFAASGAGRAGWRETSRAQRETALSLRRVAHPEQHTHERTGSGASGLPAGSQQRGNPTA